MAAALSAGEVDAGAAFGFPEDAEAIRDEDSGEFGASDLGKLVGHWAGAFRRDHAGAVVLLRPACSFASKDAFGGPGGAVIYVGYRLSRAALDGFENEYGYKPTPVRVALDTIAIFTHRDNPIRGLTLAQLGSAFSHSPGCRGEEYAATWGALGLTGEWRVRPLQVFGIGSGDDMYDYFSEQVLCGSELSRSVQVRPDSAAVARAVSESLNAIGYGRGGRTSVKTTPLAVETGMPFVAPTERNAVNGSYPLTRFLHLYVDKRPGRPLTGPPAEFVRFALSADGQRIARRNGFIPVPQDVAKKEQNLVFMNRP